MESKTLKLIIAGILGVAGMIFFLSTYFTVAETERTVVTRFGKFSYVADPGLHFRIPFVNATTVYHVGIDSMVISAGKGDKGQLVGVNTYSVDNQEVDIIATLQYRISPDKVQFLFENVPDYRTRLFDMVVDRLKSEMGKVNATHVAEKRGEIKKAVQDVLQRDGKVLGVTVTDFQLTNIEYQKGFRDAVAAAANAKAGIDTRENEQKQAEKVAQTEKIKAQGVADAVKAKADGDAYALLKNATAQAEALRIQNAALAQNKDVLELRRIEVDKIRAERWKGEVPQQMFAGAPIPFVNVAK